MTSGQKTKPWLELGSVALFAMLTVLGAELVFQTWARPTQLREVEDAMREYRDSDPTTLCIGSSHGRTFAVVDQQLRARTGGSESMLAVPVEWGKLSSYHWVLENRLRPLIEETNGNGELVRPSLERFLLVTEWWDTTIPEGGGPSPNIPSRSWTWKHFANDVLENGLGTYNGNYTSNRWRRLWYDSILVGDRGHGRILDGLVEKFRPTPEEVKTRRFEQTAALWRTKIENADPLILREPELDAMTDILDYFDGRGIETTVLLYPRMPATMSAKGKASTLARFSREIEAICRDRGLRFIDLTHQHPIRDDEYADDFDHIIDSGNERLASWMLDGPLAYLLDPSERDTAGDETAGGGDADRETAERKTAGEENSP